MNNARLRALDPSAKAKLDETLLLKALQAAFGSKKRVTVDHGSRAGSITSSRGGEEGSSAVIAGASEGVEITGLARRFFEANAGLSFVSELIINNDDTPATLSVPLPLCRYSSSQLTRDLYEQRGYSRQILRTLSRSGALQVLREPQ